MEESTLSSISIPKTLRTSTVSSYRCSTCSDLAVIPEYCLRSMISWPVSQASSFLARTSSLGALKPPSILPPPPPLTHPRLLQFPSYLISKDQIIHEEEDVPMSEISHLAVSDEVSETSKKQVQESQTTPPVQQEQKLEKQHLLSRMAAFVHKCFARVGNATARCKARAWEWAVNNL